MSGTPETILAFDFGWRRIGVAVGQQVTASASPLAMIANTDIDARRVQIATLCKEWRPDRLIVGMPLNADGSASEIGGAVTEFITDLQQHGLPIESVDERYSSLEAQTRLKQKRKAGLTRRVTKGMIDSAAAAEIAERWLRKEH